MGFYSGALRILVHVAGVILVAGSTLFGYASKFGLVGALIGFGAGLLTAGFVLGVIALTFEIRDKLEQIRMLLASGGSIPGDGRREPTL